MFDMLALSHSDTQKLLDMETVIGMVEMAYQLKSEKQASLFPMIFHEFEPGVADMDIKSGHLAGAGIFGLKLVSWFGPNAEKGLPQLVGTVMVFDSHTGVPKAILSAEHITCMRTGAAGAVGAKYLARKDSKTLLMVGAGNQAAFQIAATLMVMNSIEKVMIWDPVNPTHAETFTQKLPERLQKEFLSFFENGSAKYEKYEQRFTVNFEVVQDIQRATGEADIIITATPSRKPMLMREWIKQGTHLSCVGSDMEGKQEVDENLFTVARIFTDDFAQSMHVGEAEIAVKKGLFSESDYIGEIGESVSGRIAGRLSDHDITLFDSTGIALQDLITADYAIRQAREKGIGTAFTL